MPIEAEIVEFFSSLVGCFVRGLEVNYRKSTVGPDRIKTHKTIFRVIFWNNLLIFSIKPMIRSIIPKKTTFSFIHQSNNSGRIFAPPIVQFVEIAAKA